MRKLTLLLFSFSLLLFIRCSKEQDSPLSNMKYGEGFIVEHFTKLIPMADNVRASLISPEQIDFEKLSLTSGKVNRLYLADLISNGIIESNASNFSKNFEEMTHLIITLRNTEFNDYEVSYLIEKAFQRDRRNRVEVRSNCVDERNTCEYFVMGIYAASLVACAGSSAIPLAGPAVAGACVTAAGLVFAKGWNDCGIAYRNCVTNEK